jgi:hypothetical protein
MRRFAFFLPMIAVIISFAIPAQAEAVTLPNICGSGKWVSCGNNAYYCTAIKGDSCKIPTFVVTRTLENWSAKQQTATKVGQGVTMKSTPKKITYKYVKRYKYVIRKGKRVKVWYSVKVAVKKS